MGPLLTRNEIMEAAGRFARVAFEFCNSETEVEAIGLGLDTGYQLGTGVPVALDEHAIPLTFPDASRKTCEDEYHYYWTGITAGRAAADPTLRNRVALCLAAGRAILAAYLSRRATA